MATTTVLQFNPNQTNQETDATYLADSNRASGFGTDAIWPSPLANKTLNQLSNYLFALFTAFAQKGYTTSDDDVALLTATCANFLTDADILPGVVNVTYSPTAAFNAAAANGFQMTLTGNVTSSTITGVTAGQLVAFYFLQDSVGGRTVSYPASFVGAIQPDSSANSFSLQMFRVDLAGIPRAVTPVMSANGIFGVTPAANDNSNKIATTAWNLLGFVFVASDNGYIKFPSWLGGFMIQWGNLAEDNFGHGTTLNFPTPFANAAFVIVANDNGTSSNPATPVTVGSGIISKTQYLISSSGVASVGWIAAGY